MLATTSYLKNGNLEKNGVNCSILQIQSLVLHYAHHTHYVEISKDLLHLNEVPMGSNHYLV